MNIYIYGDGSEMCCRELRPPEPRQNKAETEAETDSFCLVSARGFCRGFCPEFLPHACRPAVSAHVLLSAVACINVYKYKHKYKYKYKYK